MIQTWKKWACGPEFPKCPCCVKGNNTAWKKANRRGVRRISKLELKKYWRENV